MEIISAFVVVACLITELTLRPRLDFSQEGEVFLWWNGGEGKRKYKKLK